MPIVLRSKNNNFEILWSDGVQAIVRSPDGELKAIIINKRGLIKRFIKEYL